VSNVRRIGLPDAMRMRHDTHFVDQLARPATESIGRLIPIEDIQPNPKQPRQTLGDLTELTASIREKGILEPLLVRKVGGHYEIIAGERRFRAAGKAGLSELPCVVRETTDAEMMELALVENLQRKDLSAFEEADGLKTLAVSYGYTHELMAERLGKSRSSITETLSLASMPEDIRNLCRLADIQSKSTLLQIVRQSDPTKMVDMLERLQQDGSTRSDARRLAKEAKARPAKGRPRAFVFQFQPKDKSFTLSLKFRKGQVTRDEIAKTLAAVVDELDRSSGS
jgi:ParB family transcriptional regulator, chromosome partitioning protein